MQSSSPAMGSRTPRNLVAARTASSPRSGYWPSQQSSGMTNQTHGKHRRHSHLPRTVTPTSSAAGASPSWDDYGNFPRRNRSKLASSDRSVVSTSYMEDEGEMPMDEMEDSMSVQSMPPIRRTHLPHRRSNSASIGDWNDIHSRSDARSGNDMHSRSDARSDRRILSMEFGSSDLGQIGLHRRTHSNLSMDWADDVSSLGGVDDRPSGLGDIIRALKHRSKSRPSHLNSDERVLWESIQLALSAVRNDEISNKRALGKLLQDATRREAQMERKLLAAQKQLMAMDGKSRTTSKHMEVQVHDLETTLKSKQADHERELRAIQRVLAEMTEEREQETGELNKKIESLNATIKELEAEKQETVDASNKSNVVVSLETGIAKMEGENLKLSEEMNPLKKELEDLREEVADLKQCNQRLESEASGGKGAGLLPSRLMTPPRHDANYSDAESVSSEEVESLQRSLSEKATSLENAKKIIASLENAIGSLALDLRSKLKAKEQELLTAQSESADSKRRLDILATELRDLQKKYGDNERAERETKAQTLKYRALVGQLERSISGLQSASVVHEVSAATGQPDGSNVDQIGDVLSDMLTTLKSTLESTPRYDEDYGSLNSGGAADLLHDLDQKKVAVRRLEEALTKQNEEVKKLRSQLEQRIQGNDQSNEQLNAEMQNLREQCAANREVLAKKERELSVLRSSLKVDENDAGYISDDDSGDEDDGDAGVPASINYGQAEALATILSHEANLNEFETLKNQLLNALSEREKAGKDLQAERESLANAKMIISSLENANKSMTEDLRCRLQDSNSAVASLMDKSMENEKNAIELREEVEQLKKEKEEERQNHLAEVKRLDVLNNVRIENEDPTSEVEEKKEESPGVSV
jgi:hypothetical protein